MCFRCLQMPERGQGGSRTNLKSQQAKHLLKVNQEVRNDQQLQKCFFSPLEQTVACLRGYKVFFSPK